MILYKNKIMSERNRYNLNKTLSELSGVVVKTVPRYTEEHKFEGTPIPLPETKYEAAGMLAPITGALVPVFPPLAIPTGLLALYALKPRLVDLIILKRLERIGYSSDVAYKDAVDSIKKFNELIDELQKDIKKGLLPSEVRKSHHILDITYNILSKSKQKLNEVI